MLFSPKQELPKLSRAFKQLSHHTTLQEQPFLILSKSLENQTKPKSSKCSTNETRQMREVSSGSS